ncbi:MAG: cytochrome c maturation protein CcmE [Candidatus Tectomicrobia bacterium]|nr:cytochrome c maturation protein CcmE [Candidatus Tectomicrobia bacterium]
MSKQHIKLAIGAAVIVAAIGYLMFSGATGNTAYFFTVPELQKQAEAVQGEAIRVAGKVTADPIQWNVQQLTLAFTMGDEGVTVPVSYKGVKPDMFQPGAEVIVEGQLGPDGVIQAVNLMTSCPSKYEEEKKRKRS